MTRYVSSEKKWITNGNAVNIEKKCDACKKIFESKRKWQKYCSAKCRYTEWDKQHLGRLINPWLALRFIVFQRDLFTCRYCGRTPLQDQIKLHCDHIVPRSKGGIDKIDNLITACNDCNAGKFDILLEEYKINKLKGRKIYDSARDDQPTDTE